MQAQVILHLGSFLFSHFFQNPLRSLHGRVFPLARAHLLLHHLLSVGNATIKLYVVKLSEFRSNAPHFSSISLDAFGTIVGTPSAIGGLEVDPIAWVRVLWSLRSSSI